MSRLVTFESGVSEARIQCYLHTTDHAAQGWYPSAAGRSGAPRAGADPAVERR